MICPLMSRPADPPNYEGSGYAECQKEECAWWDGINSCCAVISLLIQISGVK